MDDTVDSRIINEEYLRSLASTLSGLGSVATVSVFPKQKQESVVASLHDEQFPEHVSSAIVEIRAYTTGDFHITYAEHHLGDRRQCRWDRHDQSHNSTDHFHPLPDAATGDAQDRDFPETLDATLRDVVLPWIDDRIGILWERE